MLALADMEFDIVLLTTGPGASGMLPVADAEPLALPLPLALALPELEMTTIVELATVLGGRKVSFCVGLTSALGAWGALVR